MGITNNVDLFTIIGSLATVLALIFSIYKYSTPSKRTEKDFMSIDKEIGIDQQVEKFVKQKLKSFFSDYKNYILIRYGSSVELEGTTPKDFDYMVLLLGYTSDEKRKQLLNGDSFGLPLLGKYIDIEYRDYNSYIFALSGGMPFEHSVLFNCSFISGDEKYLNWIKQIQKNFIIDTAYIIKTLKDRCKEYQMEIENELAKNESDYTTLIGLYSLSSALIQIDILKSFPTIVNFKYLIPISKSSFLLKNLPDGELKESYREIVRYFKRDYIPNQTLPQDIRELKNRFLLTFRIQKWT